jgi:cytochrome c553
MLVWLLPLSVLSAPPSVEAAGSGQAVRRVDVDFNRDIRPIFSERCYSCHGAEKQKGGLRLDNKASALGGGDDGDAIKPGNSGKSSLFNYVAGLDPEKIMPPKGERLTSSQIESLRKWIDAGAPWPDETTSASESDRRNHWSFKAPVRPNIPPVRNKRWIRNTIDDFVLARLEEQGVTPSPEADRVTLIRRVSLDLIGLPPTPEEVRDFISDRASGAYDRLVDRLLASPHFGERWGRHWLDLARYADSDGYQIDRPRPYAYLYRDWVINAINRDLPFDEFTIEQLAGDLLPNATLEQKIATGFHRNTLVNNEDGVDQEEFRCKAKVDRVSVTGTTWLGLTLGCAECHSHKYDPISQREFYQLYAFFDGAVERDIPAARPTDAAAKAMVFAASASAPRTYVHVRGDFLRRGDEVQPGVLSVLQEFKPRSAKPDRLDLAHWLVDPANPLTARVAANRFWQHLFGRGLVSTPEDFGVRGERPSHPELLDWLATEFIRQNWSRKEMIRLIVSSATYRQSSRYRPELAERDPQNTLVARQNRFRLEAEAIRDGYLAVGGLLNDELGGPSFHPYMPDDVKALGAAGAFTWVDTEGAQKYRRGLYIYAQRTVPYPVSMLFDQANPSETCPRREHSNTPLQALTLLNNGIFVECAQGLARRMMTRRGSSPRERIESGFELCMAREPGGAELDRLDKLFEDERRSARGNCASGARQGGSRSSQKTADPDGAAYVAVAQVMMNLDEFVTRE